MTGRLVSWLHVKLSGIVLKERFQGQFLLFEFEDVHFPFCFVLASDEMTLLRLEFPGLLSLSALDYCGNEISLLN